MRITRLTLALLLAALAAPPLRATEAAPTPPTDAPRTAALVPAPRPADSARADPNPAAPICHLIEKAAREASLDPHFFARLIWRESLFDPAALSPKGAQGIAQFMPDTADLRGLANPFDPEQALPASARYLAELRDTFGNIGLAAAAYNGGEARMARYVAQGGDLPDETRAYVTAITGHSAQDWRDSPPKSIDLTLKGDTFEAGCLALATTRGRGETTAEPPPPPWGVVIASNRDRAGARLQVDRLRNRYGDVLAGETVHYTRGRRLGMSRGLLVAQVGRESKAEAEKFCSRLRATGADCVVLRN